ncbi:MAG: hypothetical protein P9L99_01075 [Candidatus Lernaella stagnicola]|nr:hypothetical protein [Candidatus Lernaella stagnicola]
MTRIPDNVLDILVICSGNMCRSPMAAAQLRAKLQEAEVRGVAVRSAGTIAPPGYPASPDAVAVAEAHGLDISYHRTTPLSVDLLRRADLVLAMDRDRHLEIVRQLEPSAMSKAFLLSEFADAGPEKGATIPDPIGTTYAFYDLIFHKMGGMLDNLVTVLKSQQPDDSVE